MSAELQVTQAIRPIRIEGDLAYIPLTRGYEAVIDAADVPFVNSWNWCASVETHTVYARRGERRDGAFSTVRLHRFIMGAPEGFDVDHKDGNGLNNRRSNLRLATKAQNAQNTPRRADNKSGFKGVYWCNTWKKWKSAIRVSGRRRELGYFDTPEAAHAAYCKASAELHGEFTRTA